MYNQQSFHTSSYRGNQFGHDAYLRSDSNSPSSFASQSTSSQYQGSTRSFQPTGNVTSYYKQPQVGQYSQQQLSQQQPQQQQMQQFHTSNYRGNQPNHDNAWRADSQQPSQSQFSGAQSYQMANFRNNQPSVSSSFGRSGF